MVARGRKFRGYACDFGDRKALYAFLEQVKRDFPVIDILVNNAGTILRKPAAEHPDEYWDHILEVNLNSQFVISREIGKEMVERGSGKIIFTASLLTFQGGITVPGYAAAQGRHRAADEGAGQRVGGRGRAGERDRAGLHRDGQHRGAAQADPVRNPAILSRIPAGRWGEPEDFKGAVVFLASAASDYVSGDDPDGRRRLDGPVGAGVSSQRATKA